MPSSLYRRLMLPLLLCSSLVIAAEGEQPPSAKQQADFDRIDQSVNALSQALNRIGEEKQRQDFAAALRATANNHQREARRLLQTGHPQQAREQLDQAMITVKTAIATLRNRETLIRSLDFADPADEYHYELDRFHSYSMLINLLLERTKPDADKRRAMEQLMEQAWQREAHARGLAQTKAYKQAINAQEQSNRLLLQAIRRGGLYVPG